MVAAGTSMEQCLDQLAKYGTWKSWRWGPDQEVFYTEQSFRCNHLLPIVMFIAESLSVFVKHTLLSFKINGLLVFEGWCCVKLNALLIFDGCQAEHWLEVGKQRAG